MTNFPVLTQASVDKLREITKSGTDVLDKKFEVLCVEFSLSTVQIPIDINAKIALQQPVGSTQETNSDLENCIIIGKIIPDLTDIQATDERLWVTLALRDYKEYSIKRWPFTDKTSSANHILNHWFAPNVRGRMRDNSIGRLWWYQRLCNRIEHKSLNETLDQLFFNSDYRSSMLERNTSSAITSVISVILDITEEYKKKDIIFKRANFREFMKKVDLLAGRSRLAVLTEKKLKEKLTALYIEAYNNDPN